MTGMTKPIFPRSQVKTKDSLSILAIKVLVFGFPTIAFVAPMALVAVLALTTILMAASIGRKTVFSRSFAVNAAIFCALPLYALLSAPFSPVDPVQSAVRSLRLFSEFLMIAVFLWCLLRVPGELGREIVLSFCYGCLAAIVVGGFMGGVFDPGGSLLRTGRMSKHAGNLLSRGLAILAIVSMPLSIWLTGAGRARRWLRASMFVFLLAAFIKIGGKSASIMGIAAGLAAACLVFRRRGNLKALAVVGLIVVAFFPLIVSAGVIDDVVCSIAAGHRSFRHRDTIWNFVVDHIRERPVLGWGLDSSRDFPGGGRRETLLQCPDVNYRELSGQVLPLHPHNAALQIWLELGGVGMAIFLSMLWIGLRYSCRRFHNIRACCALAGYIGSLSVVALASFGIWQGWWLAAIAFTLGITLLICRSLEDEAVENSDMDPKHS